MYMYMELLISFSNRDLIAAFIPMATMTVHPSMFMLQKKLKKKKC